MLVLALASTVQAATPRAGGTGKNLEAVGNTTYENGMHLAVTRIDGRDYVFSSASRLSADGGIRVFDVTNPARHKQVASIPCTGGQGFLQISHDNKTLVVGEGVPHGLDACMPPEMKGIYTIDISNPRKPKPLGYASIERGGHHITTHPTKPFVYVSHGDVPGMGGPAEFQIWSIKNPAKPKYVSTAKVTGYHGPHDITFNAKGTRAVASSMSAIQVLDTSDPAKPKELQVLQCPGCSHNHEAHFTPDQKHVVVSEETGGGAPSPCPLGGLYFYEFKADGPEHMKLIGTWNPGEIGTPEGARTNAPVCTSHVFGISNDGTKIAASWHNAGVRVIDITDMAGHGVGAEGDGAKEIGWYVSPGADSWNAQFDRTGRFVFVNDANYGFEVYRLKSN